MTPFLKWAGAKTRVLSHIRSLLPPPAEYEAFAEPFLGSGSVFLNLAPGNTTLLGDANDDVMLVWRCLRENPEDLIRRAAGLFREGNTVRRYYALRNRFNAGALSEADRAATFLYLNRHGFNGLCRYNRRGEYNVSFGRYSQPYFPESELRAAATKVRPARLMTGDFSRVFERILDDAPDRFVIYCDPPYASPDQPGVFTAYGPTNFCWDDQVRLAEWARAVAARGAWVMVSNAATPCVKDLYQDTTFVEFEVRRSISASGARRGQAKELLAVFAPDRLKDILDKMIRPARAA
jgi:DNA adenine methylase